MPPVYSTSRWKAKLQLLQLSNLSCSNCNLVAHITIGREPQPHQPHTRSSNLGSDPLPPLHYQTPPPAAPWPSSTRASCLPAGPPSLLWYKLDCAMFIKAPIFVTQILGTASGCTDHRDQTSCRRPGSGQCQHPLLKSCTSTCTSDHTRCVCPYSTSLYGIKWHDRTTFDLPRILPSFGILTEAPS
jgi:hypothetical protein